MDSDFEKLKEKYPKENDRIERIYTRYKKAESIQTIIGNFAVQEMIRNFQSQIQIINTKLLSSEPLSEIERSNLITARDLYDNIICRYFQPDKKIEKIKQFIKKKL